MAKRRRGAASACLAGEGGGGGREGRWVRGFPPTSSLFPPPRLRAGEGGAGNEDGPRAGTWVHGRPAARRVVGTCAPRPRNVPKQAIVDDPRAGFDASPWRYGRLAGGWREAALGTRPGIGHMNASLYMATGWTAVGATCCCSVAAPVPRQEVARVQAGEALCEVGVGYRVPLFPVSLSTCPTRLTTRTCTTCPGPPLPLREPPLDGLPVPRQVPATSPSPHASYMHSGPPTSAYGAPPTALPSSLIAAPTPTHRARATNDGEGARERRRP